MLDMKYKMTSLLEFFSKIWKIFPYSFLGLSSAEGNSWKFAFPIYYLQNDELWHQIWLLKKYKNINPLTSIIGHTRFRNPRTPTCPISILGFANLAESWRSEKNQLKLGAYAIADTQLKISNLLHESVTLR